MFSKLSRICRKILSFFWSRPLYLSEYDRWPHGEPHAWRDDG
jgi:hypothetical protein